MSEYVDTTVSCPACGRETLCSLARSVNIDGSPDVREAVMANRFQRVECPGCSHRFDALGPFAYNDLGRGQWVGVAPSAWATDWLRVERRLRGSFEAARSTAPASLAGALQAMTVRTVFGLDALAEKLWAWETGIDDVELELFKLDVIRSRGLVLHPDHCPRLLRVEGDTLVMAVSKANDAARAIIERVIVTWPRQAVAGRADAAEWADARRRLTASSHVDLGCLLRPLSDETRDAV